MNNRTKNIVIIIAVIVGVVVLAAFYSNFIRTGAGKGDFAALYKASAHALQTGSLNDPDSLGYYPPSGRPILMLFALLPLRPAAILWFVLAVGLEGFCLYLLIQHLLPKKTASPGLLAALVALVMTPWLSADLSGGNVSPLILASLVIGYYFYRKNRPWLSGFTLAIGIAVKFLPVFMIFFYAIKRQWKMTAIACVMTLALALIPGTLIFGPRDFAQSWQTWSGSALSKRTAQSMILEGGISYINQSWANVLLHSLSSVNAGHHDETFYVNIASFSRWAVLKIWYVLMFISGLAWIILLWPKKNDPADMMLIHFPLVCLPMLWFSPHVMSYYMTILLPALTLLLWAVLNRQEPCLKPLATVLIILLAVFVLGDFSVASQYARAYGSYQLMIFTLALAIALIARRARQSSFLQSE